MKQKLTRALIDEIRKEMPVLTGNEMLQRWRWWNYKLGLFIQLHAPYGSLPICARLC